VVWAPEFVKFPSWAHGVELMLAEAAGWSGRSGQDGYTETDDGEGVWEQLGAIVMDARSASI
jgi:hypothetical protein